MALQSVRFCKLSCACDNKEVNDAVGKSYIKVSRFLHGASESPIIWVNNESKWVMGLSFYSFSDSRLRLIAQLSRTPSSYEHPWPFGFFWWFSHLWFGLGRDPITPPDPAMVFIDRNDLNLKKQTKRKQLWTAIESFNNSLYMESLQFLVIHT